MTRERVNALGEGMIFADTEEVDVLLVLTKLICKQG